MPSWGIHLAVANRLIRKLENNKLNQKERNEFIFANILPDINNGYVVKNIEEVISHKITHFELEEYKGDYTSKPGYINFYEEYKNDLENPIILGYYAHLMTDFYFNNTTYKEYGIFDENNNRIGVKLNNGKNLIIEKENVRKIKVNDFKIFSFYLYKNEKIDILEYDQNIIKNSKKIQNINITKEDMYKTIEYIKSCIDNPEQILDILEDREYKIYTEEELKKRIGLCVKFILENIK